MRAGCRRRRRAFRRHAGLIDPCNRALTLVTQ
jgi:hypothetical protein